MVWSSRCAPIGARQTWREGRKLFIATWKHGVSIYGWDQGRAADFAASHPQLITGRGTIRLRPADADAIGDEVLRHLVRTALTP